MDKFHRVCERVFFCSEKWSLENNICTRLPTALQDIIQNKYNTGKSVRTIALELGLDDRTVKKYCTNHVSPTLGTPIHLTLSSVSLYSFIYLIPLCTYVITKPHTNTLWCECFDIISM